VVFSIVDVQMFIIRIVVFFLVLGLLIGMFVALGEITRGTELDRKLNELGESMLSSEFTIARAVFDPRQQSPSVGSDFYGLRNSVTEPLRFCRNPATFEFLILEGGEYKSKWKFGYTNPYAKLESIKRDWNVWIKNDRGDIVPGIMRITLWSPPFDHDTTTGKITGIRAAFQGEIIDLSCAVSSAWTLKREEVAEFFCNDIGGCQIYPDGEKVCYADLEGNVKECRYIGANVQLKDITLDYGTTKMRVIPVTRVMTGSDYCLDVGYGASKRDALHEFSIKNDQTKEIAQIILCPIRQGVQGDLA
jgi:hypothetical protein